MGPSPPKAPRRGEIYHLNPNPTAGREMRGWHHWIVITPEALNVHGVSLAVPVSTVALGAREVGITVPVTADGVTGVAVCTHVRSFDLRARLLAGTARREGTAPADVVEEICARVIAMIDVPPDPTPKPTPKPARARPAEAATPTSITAQTRGRARTKD